MSNVRPMRSQRTPKPVEEFDEWGLEEGSKYNELHFYVGTKDEEGHTITVTLGVPLSVHNFVAELIAQRKIPAYRQPRDFYRDAFWHRMNTLKRDWLQAGELSEELERQLNVLMREQRSLYRRQTLEQRINTVNTTRENLKRFLDEGDLEMFRKEMEDAQDAIDSWPPCGARTQMETLVNTYKGFRSDEK